MTRASSSASGARRCRPGCTWWRAIGLSVLLGLRWWWSCRSSGPWSTASSSRSSGCRNCSWSWLLGSACFCALGLAISGLVPNERAAPAVVNATILPLLFISDVFIRLPADNTLARIGDLFPVRHMAVALQSIWVPQVNGPLDLKDVGFLVIWTAIGLVVALRRFSWEPRG